MPSKVSSAAHSHIIQHATETAAHLICCGGLPLLFQSVATSAWAWQSLHPIIDWGTIIMAPLLIIPLAERMTTKARENKVCCVGVTAIKYRWNRQNLGQYYWKRRRRLVISWMLGAGMVFGVNHQLFDHHHHDHHHRQEQHQNDKGHQGGTDLYVCPSITG